MKAALATLAFVALSLSGCSDSPNGGGDSRWDNPLYACHWSGWSARGQHPGAALALGPPDPLPPPGGEAEWSVGEAHHSLQMPTSEDGILPPGEAVWPWSASVMLGLLWRSHLDDGAGVVEGVHMTDWAPPGHLRAVFAESTSDTVVRSEVSAFLRNATDLDASEIAALTDPTGGGMLPTSGGPEYTRFPATTWDWGEEAHQAFALDVPPERLTVWNLVLADPAAWASEPYEGLAIVSRGPWAVSLFGAIHVVEVDREEDRLRMALAISAFGDAHYDVSAADLDQDQSRARMQDWLEELGLGRSPGFDYEDHWPSRGCTFAPVRPE